MSRTGEGLPGPAAEEAAEETWASLRELFREAATVYAAAHRTLAASVTEGEEPARSARAGALEAARRLTELARNCDLLERAAPESALVAHLVSGRRQLRALADSLLLLSSVRAPADMEMLPLLGPQELRAELRSPRTIRWLEGPPQHGGSRDEDLRDPFSDFDWA